MKKTITIYELLGLIKDGKAPKEIEYDGERYIYDNDLQDYEKINKNGFLFDSYNASPILNDELEIISDEEEFEDIEENNDIIRFDDLVCPYGANEEKFMKYIIIFQEQINQLIKNQKILIEKIKIRNKV